MDPTKIPWGSAWKINFNLLMAFLLAAAAYGMWPHAPRNWGLAVASFCLAAGAVGSLKKAWIQIVLLRNRARDVGGFLAAHPEPKLNSLAREDELRKAGMK